MFTLIRELRDALNRVASAIETANTLSREKNRLSEDVLTFQREMLEIEKSRTVVHVKPDIGITTEVGKELAKQTRATRGRQA